MVLYNTMKVKIIAFAIFIILVVSSFFTMGLPNENVSVKNEAKKCIGKEMRERVQFSPPLLKDKGDFLVVKSNEATSFTKEPSQPMLPVYTKIFTFPIGTKIKEVRCTVFGEEEMEVEKEIVTFPEPMPMSVFALNEKKSHYQTPSFFPNAWYGYKTGGGLCNNNHVTFLVIHIYPVRYAQDGHILRYIKGAEIKVVYEEPLPFLFPDIYDLLILAPSEFSDALQPLIQHKENYGIKTKLVTLNEIYNGEYFPSQGRDDAEKIKYFIKDAIEQWGIKYVLLVGDIKHLPSREVLSFYWGSHKMLSDHYYADIYDANMNFCSWDSNGNNLFGEVYDEYDFVDLYADVHVGRLACKDVEEVTTVVDKIISYEETAYGKEWFSRLIVMGGDTFPRWGVVEGEVVNEYVIQAMPDFTPIKIQTSLHNFFPNKINEALTEGAGFVSYSGHGFEYGFGTYPKNSYWMIAYYTPYLLFLENEERLPIIFFDACLTAKLDYHMLGNPDIPCFAWCMVKKPNGGAIAAIGATETAITSVDENGPQGQAGYLNLHFFMAYEPGITVSEMLTHAKNDYLNDVMNGNADDRLYVMTIEQFILLGDPSLKVGGFP
ncbi:MAG: hypothetical protein FE048_04025 [Thermoplasmata archaeon]|nr:MAG: hypothetical protein FE048_04025 [Thermoplasmata archaeon]